MSLIPKRLRAPLVLLIVLVMTALVAVMLSPVVQPSASQKGSSCSNPFERTWAGGASGPSSGDAAAIQMSRQNGDYYSWSRRGANVICSVHVVLRDGQRLRVPSGRIAGAYRNRRSSDFRRLIVRARRPSGSETASRPRARKGSSCSNPYRVYFDNTIDQMAGDRGQISTSIRLQRASSGDVVTVSWRPSSGMRICESVLRFTTAVRSIQCRPMGRDVTTSGWRIRASRGGSCQYVHSERSRRREFYVTARRR